MFDVDIFQKIINKDKSANYMALRAGSYIPKSTKEILGQDESILRLKKFIINYKDEKKRAALIYGPSGTGKTISVHVIASELGYELIEVNASDFRNAHQINEKVGNALKQRSLFATGKIILIDEIDGLSGHEDRGGVQAITKVMQDSVYPIIMTATNPFDNKFSSLRSKSNLLEFKPIDYLFVFEILKQICKIEKIKHNESDLKILSRRAGGDARAAISDLFSLSSTAEGISKAAIDGLSDRLRKESIMSALNKIFKSTDLKLAISAFDNVDEDIDQQFLWIDENLPKEYLAPLDLSMAYDMISKADVFSRRIRRWQHYRFLVYINAFLTAGIAASKSQRPKGLVEYKPTGRLLKIWWANQKAAKKKGIAEKIASKTHSSTKEVLNRLVPYLLLMFRNKSTADNLIREFDLSEEEIEWIRGK